MTRPGTIPIGYGSDALSNPASGLVIWSSPDGKSFKLQRDDGLITSFPAPASDTHGSVVATLVSDANGGLTLDRLNLGTGTGAIAGALAFATSGASGRTSNTMKIYEEGTWTPAIGADGSAPSGQTYSTQVGNYVRIGSLVIALFNATLTALGTATGTYASVWGLPFAVAVNNVNGLAGGRAFGFATNVATIGGYANATATYFYLSASASVGTSPLSAIAKSVLGNSSGVSGAFIYLA